MKSPMRLLLIIAALSTPIFSRAQDDAPTLMASSGKITALATNEPQWITAEIKTPGGTTSRTFTVTSGCKFITSGFGAYGELKRGDNVKLEYAEKEGGTNELAQVYVMNAAPAAAAPKTTTPAKAPAKKPVAKTPAKKPAAKKPAPKK